MTEAFRAGHAGCDQWVRRQPESATAATPTNRLVVCASCVNPQAAEICLFTLERDLPTRPAMV